MIKKKQIGFFKDLINVKMPIDREIISNSLQRVFDGISLDEIVNFITNEFEQIIEYYELSRGERRCERMAILFNPHLLNVIVKGNKFSFYSAIKNQPNFINGMARVLIMRKKEGVSLNKLFYRIIQLNNLNGIQFVADFPPIVARKMCQKFGVMADMKVLDPCAGWGGRMIGISTVSNNYTCFEPSTKK